MRASPLGAGSLSRPQPDARRGEARRGRAGQASPAHGAHEPGVTPPAVAYARHSCCSRRLEERLGNGNGENSLWPRWLGIPIRARGNECGNVRPGRHLPRVDSTAYMRRINPPAALSTSPSRSRPCLPSVPAPQYRRRHQHTERTTRDFATTIASPRNTHNDQRCAVPLTHAHTHTQVAINSALQIFESSLLFFTVPIYSTLEYPHR